ncbi:hypothetical protein K2173_017402 [Erythroxylum novogranatense]|uniref:Uncharacterized protein n=1 Tax=Erythroxylum novogranatense TaxID=1862640 RepID=A0AAV8TN65_9ROSI|nr:hypothetical protein K2173_017402 [Erythroxylum novogranatense]
MKLFNWMQTKFNGGSPNCVSVHHHTRQEICKEEFSDWPQCLLAIGTLGNKDVKENSKQNHLQENPLSSQDQLQELTPDEVRELKKELDSIMNKQDGSAYDTESDTTDRAWDRLLKIQSSMDNDKRAGDVSSHELENKGFHLQHKATVVVKRGKDIRVDKTTNAINKKSLSFLIKKLFICRSGLTTTPGIRDQVPESRVEKILRTIIHKKIYPQNRTPTATGKKYLKNKQKPVSFSEVVTDEKVDDGSKWVKTDSEYIVLEI